MPRKAEMLLSTQGVTGMEYEREDWLSGLGLRKGEKVKRIKEIRTW